MSDHPAEEDRLDRMAEYDVDQPDWRDQFEPGTFGCHELLDRVSLISNQLEQYILDHPACLQNPAWFALAQQALRSLTELYQQIGTEHLTETPTAASMAQRD